MKRFGLLLLLFLATALGAGAQAFYHNQLEIVRDDASGNVGVKNAEGQLIIPCEYQRIWSQEFPGTDEQFRLILASRKKGKTQSVFLFRPDGSKATERKLNYAEIYMGAGPAEHRLIVGLVGEGYALMDEDGNILTPQRYKEFGNGFMLDTQPDVTDFWGMRDGRYYLISPADGHETATFTFKTRSMQGFFSRVKIRKL